MNEPAKIKRCTDCKYYARKRTELIEFEFGSISINKQAECYAPHNLSVVDGSGFDTPDRLRYGGGCAEEGLWFEPRVGL